MFPKSSNIISIRTFIALATIILLIQNTYAQDYQDHQDRQPVDLPPGDTQQHPDSIDINNDASDNYNLLPLPMQVPHSMKIGRMVEETNFENTNQQSDDTQPIDANQQPLNIGNTMSKKDRDFYKGKILYIEAKAILNTLPNVPNPDNIGRYYRPRRNLWSIFYDGAFQSVCNFVLFPVPEASRLQICGVSPSLDDDNSQSQPMSMFSHQSRAFLSAERQRELKILDNKKLELKRAFALLEESSELGNKDSIFTKAELYFYGNYTHSQDFYKSYKLYHQLAETSGNATAQFMLGVMYSTGMFGTTPQDQARANLYYTFAAENGDFRAKMAMGYRYQQGVGVPRNYKTAAKYFKETATIAYQYFTDGPPGGRYLTQYSWLLSDKDGGILGEGASLISPVERYPGLPLSFTQSFDMAVRYLDYLSLLDEGGAVANYALARLHFSGDNVVDPNFEKAIEYVKKCLEQTINQADSDSIALKGYCAGFIGLRYLRGEGVPQSYSEALKWLTIGSENKDEAAKSALGLMYMEGLGVEKDEKKAVELFKESEKLGPSNYHLGRYYLRNGDLSSAYLRLDAASKKSVIGGLYHFGMMLQQGIWGKEADSALYFQLISERVHDFHSPLRWAHVQYSQGDFGSALLGFIIAGEEGYREAQVNAAYMLDDQRSVIDLGKIINKISNILPRIPFSLASTKTKFSDEKEVSQPKEIDGKEVTDFGNFVHNDPTDYTTWKQQKKFLAFSYWSRLANSYNVDAIVKVGDCFLQGIGVKQNLGEAASRYQVAADYNSAIARWNLGWMYENGIGVDKDFHLAKRHYDTAAVSAREAYFPVTLSLLKLRIRSYWNSWWPTSEDIHNTLAEPENEEERDTFIEGEISVDDPNNRPKSFREGVWLIFNKWKEERGNRPRSNYMTEYLEESGLDLSDEEVEELETYLYTYTIYLIIIITLFVVIQRWRANQQQEPAVPMPVQRNDRNQQREEN